MWRQRWGEIPNYAPSGSIHGSVNSLGGVSYQPLQDGRTLCDIPGSKVDTIDLYWLGEGESKSRESDEAGSEGQGASYTD